MIHKKDWILENIRKAVHAKQLKVEIVSKELGISKGEFSKILSGQRKDYYKYLPQLSEILQIGFHALVVNNGVEKEENHNETKKDYVSEIYPYSDKGLYERIIYECNQKDKAKDELLKKERESKENYIRKYKKTKSKLQAIENKLKAVETNLIPRFNL